MIPYSKVKVYNEEFKNMQEEIYKSIIMKKPIYIKYKNNNGKISERIIEPYRYLKYKGEKYLVAYCSLRKEIRFFKLLRINEYRIIDEEFRSNVDVNSVLEGYKKNSIGIFGGEEYNLVLEIKPPMANTISERIWVDNQVIGELDNGVIRFTATMKGGPEIVSWILSMGNCVKIVQPDKLREEILKKLKEMQKYL